MDITNEQATAMLDKLLPSGALQIITSEHQCGLPGLAGTPEQADHCRAYAAEQGVDVDTTNHLTDPAHFVVHVVTRIEPVEHRGTLRAYTAEGDFCEGPAPALLVRLLQARYGTKDRARVAIEAKLDS